MAAECVRDHTLRDLGVKQDDGALGDFPPFLFFDTSGCDMPEDDDGHDDFVVASQSDPKKDSHMSSKSGVKTMSRSNAAEAKVVVEHAIRLMHNGLPPNAIAIITPYNGQVEAIRAMLREADENNAGKMTVPTGRLLGALLSSIAVRTVDGFQGGEVFDVTSLIRF